MGLPIKRSYFKNVNALTEDSDEIVIPNGETWEIQSWMGSANSMRDTHVCIIWDYEGASPEIIALTYASLKCEINRSFIGNGTKKIALILRNDTLSAERLGAEMIYRVTT